MNPQRFIRVMAGYTLMSDDELGINTYIKEDKAGKYIIFKGEDKAKEEKLYLAAHIWAPGRWEPKKVGTCSTQCRGRGSRKQRQRQPKTAAKVPFWMRRIFGPGAGSPK
jgi:hypothetical protein